MTCNTAVIIRRHRVPGNRNLECLRLTRCKFFRLGKSAKSSGRLAKYSLRRLTVNLYHFFTDNGTRIGHLCADHNVCIRSISCRLIKFCLHRKGRIGKSEAERIKNLVLGKGLKITISYIDILLINIALLIPVVNGGRIVRDILGDRVRQLT